MLVLLHIFRYDNYVNYYFLHVATGKPVAAASLIGTGFFNKRVQEGKKLKHIFVNAN